MIFRQLEVCGTLLGSFFFFVFTPSGPLLLLSNIVFALHVSNLVAFSSILSQHSVLRVTAPVFSSHKLFLPRPRLLLPLLLPPDLPLLPFLPSFYLTLSHSDMQRAASEPLETRTYVVQTPASTGKVATSCSCSQIINSLLLCAIALFAQLFVTKLSPTGGKNKTGKGRTMFPCFFRRTCSAFFTVYHLFI